MDVNEKTVIGDDLLNEQKNTAFIQEQNITLLEKFNSFDPALIKENKEYSEKYEKLFVDIMKNSIFSNEKGLSQTAIEHAMQNELLSTRAQGVAYLYYEMECMRAATLHLLGSYECANYIKNIEYPVDLNTDGTNYMICFNGTNCLLAVKDPEQLIQDEKKINAIVASIDANAFNILKEYTVHSYAIMPKEIRAQTANAMNINGQGYKNFDSLISDVCNQYNLSLGEEPQEEHYIGFGN